MNFLLLIAFLHSAIITILLPSYLLILQYFILSFDVPLLARLGFFFLSFKEGLLGLNLTLPKASSKLLKHQLSILSETPLLESLVRPHYSLH
jgi:hypothetical protein